MKKGLTWYAHRVMRMDAQEIVWRVGSLAREIVEAGRIITHTEPSVSGPLPNGAFHTTLLSSAEHLASLTSAQRAELKRYADALLSNQIEFFGRRVDLGNDIDWRRDWNQALTPELRLSIVTDYRDAANSGDCKEVWEPNRHHQLVVLARAYHAFEDQRYALKVAELLADWLDKNPYGYGMNWRSPLELGIRLINWVWALDLIRGSEAITSELSAKLHQAVFLQCRDLAAKFSQGSSANNHLIGEAAGLFIAASYWFPDSRAEWISESRQILEEQLIAQQTDSGCTAEQALNYQFFVAQFYLFCGCVDEWTTQSLSSDYWSKLSRYLSFIERFEGFRSQLPLFGDQDDGYVLNLGYHPHDLDDYSGWLSAIRGEAEMGHSASALLLGSREWSAKVAADEQNPQCKSQLEPVSVLADAGYALLNAPEHGIAVIFDAGPLGYGSMAAHGHADALHFACSIDGLPLFVDSGTYDYFTYPELRSYFRSTRAHNTISLAGTDQSSMSGPFMWNDAAQARFGAHQGDDRSIAVTGEITRYCGMEDKCRNISRTLKLDRASGTLNIVDDIDLIESVSVQQFFHIHPDVKVRLLRDSTYEFTIGSRTACFTVPETADHRLITSGDLASFSPAYHQLRTGSCIVVESTSAERCQLTFSLAVGQQLAGSA